MYNFDSIEPNTDFTGGSTNIGISHRVTILERGSNLTRDQLAYMIAALEHMANPIDVNELDDIVNDDSSDFDDFEGGVLTPA